MRLENRYVASLFLSAALLSPIAVHAMATPQDDQARQEQEEHNRRVMDEETHQYRAWDKAEDDAYRHWLEVKHRTYVDYEKLDEKTRREYWKWRHEHEDHAH
jgi:Tfp pilus assembly protein PilV